MFEKEGFGIFQSRDRLDYLLMSGRPAHVFTDHRNIFVVFAPLVLEPALGRPVMSKVQRWALFLSKYAYVIEHIVVQRDPLLLFTLRCKCESDTYDNANTRRFHVYNERQPRTSTANDYGYYQLPRGTRIRLTTLPTR